MDNRYFKALEGCDVNDIKADEPGELSGETYTYYLFLRPGGSGGILRENSDSTEFRLFLFSSFNEDLWSNRQTQSYKRTSGFPKL